MADERQRAAPNPVIGPVSGQLPSCSNRGDGFSAFAGKEHSSGYFPDDLFQEEPEIALFESAKGDVPKSSSQEVSERFLQFGETEMETGLQCFFRDDPLAVENQ